MLNNLKPEDIRKTDLNFLPTVLSKLSLFNLSSLYNHFKETLDYSSELIKEVYTDTQKETLEQKIHKEQVYDKCMKNLKYSELILFHIKTECDNRNLNSRFNTEI